MSNESGQKSTRTGVAPGIISCVLAVLGIYTFFGVLFVPLAAITALIGTIIAVKNAHWGGILANALAWVLTLVGLFMSPSLLAVLGFRLGSTG